MLQTANIMLITVSIWMTLRSLFDIKRDFLRASPDFRSSLTTFGKSSGRKRDGRRASTLLVASAFLNVYDRWIMYITATAHMTWPKSGQRSYMHHLAVGNIDSTYASLISWLRILSEIVFGNWPCRCNNNFVTFRAWKERPPYTAWPEGGISTDIKCSKPFPKMPRRLRGNEYGLNVDGDKLKKGRRRGSPSERVDGNLLFCFPKKWR